MEIELVSDWRGHRYNRNELLNKPCDDCGKPAVRNCCIREGDADRTHWHGEIHTFDGHIKALCRKCAETDHKKRRKK